MQHLEDTSTTYAVAVAVIGYSLCSSTLLLVNKMSLVYLPLPAILSVIQIFVAAAIVFTMKVTGLQKVDDLQWDKVKAYGVYIFAFVAAIYCNMKALAASNVETVIVFRACSPLAVTIIDYLWMDREWPCLRSQISLLCVAFGAIMYCLTDSQFVMNGISAYYWVLAYFFLITFEMTYGKSLTSNIKMESVWGPVYYCNVLSIIPMALLGYSNGDFIDLRDRLGEVASSGAWLILFSCIVGTLIGYTGWLCRGMVSATTYTLVGVVNKFLTILLNVILWDKHASWFGLFCVTVCLLAGVFYQQAPKRSSGLPISSTSSSAGGSAMEMKTTRGGSSSPTTRLTRIGSGGINDREELESLTSKSNQA